MYKRSAKYLQGLENERSHIAYSRTLMDSFCSSNASFLAHLRDGCMLRAIVCDYSGCIAQISFRDGNFKGMAFTEKDIRLKKGDMILVELFERTIGSDGKMYLKTNFVKRLSGRSCQLKCKKCGKEFGSIEELSSHLEYTCRVNICRYCGAACGKNELYHMAKACMKEAVLNGKKKPNKKHHH